MSKSELIVGLDIGTTKMCAVVGEPNDNGGMDIVGIGTSPSTGLRKGVVVNIEQTVQSIKRALEEAELMAGCEIRSVYAGIAGSHIKGFNSHGVIAVKGGEVSPRDIERALDAAKAVAIPGTSEHQLGLAVDIVDANMQDLTDEQENTATQKWLMANSWRYGFIHRYPNDKTDITGIIYEPWHYRYVGKDAAQDIFNRDITLEEYLGKAEH